MARKNRFSNWREDLHEYLGTNTSMADRANAVPAKAKTDTKALKKIDTAKVNNKIVINPPMKEAFEEIGGTLLEVVEIEEELSVERRQKAAAIGAKSPSYKTRFAAMKLASGDNKPVRGKGNKAEKRAAELNTEEYVDEEGKLGHLQQKRAMVDMKIAKERVKMAKKAKKSGEDVVTEKINIKKADMGDVVKDFYKSDAPQFKGKSKEKRREMAIAAKLQADED